MVEIIVDEKTALDRCSRCKKELSARARPDVRNPLSEYYIDPKRYKNISLCDSCFDKRTRYLKEADEKLKYNITLHNKPMHIDYPRPFEDVHEKGITKADWQIEEAKQTKVKLSDE